MIDEIGSEESPESILAFEVETMPEVGVEFLFSREKVVDIIGKVVLIDMYSLDVFCSRELVLSKTKRKNYFLITTSCDEDSIGPIRISQYCVAEIGNSRSEPVGKELVIEDFENFARNYLKISLIFREWSV